MGVVEITSFVDEGSTIISQDNGVTDGIVDGGCTNMLRATGVADGELVGARGVVLTSISWCGFELWLNCNKFLLVLAEEMKNDSGDYLYRVKRS